MSVSCELSLHPEFLTNEQLIRIMQERYLKVPNIETMGRDQLLELFHHYCVPYGQRKYKDSGRGKVLNKTQNRSPEHKPVMNKISDAQNRNWFNSSHNDSLKPGPDLLAGHMKRIKLENTQQMPVSKDNSNKRKMSIDNLTPDTDSPPPKKNRNPITWP